MGQPSFALALAATFEGQPVSTLTYKEKPHWLAREIGSGLGYEKDGGHFVQMVTHGWSEELADEVVRVPRDECPEELRQMFDARESRVSNGRGGWKGDIILLTERGVFMATLLSKKQKGRDLRRWLATDVLPKLARGEEVGLALAPQRLALPAPVAEAVAWMPRVSDASPSRDFLVAWRDTFALGELVDETGLLRALGTVDPWWTRAPKSIARKRVRYLVRHVVGQRFDDLIVVQVKQCGPEGGIWTLLPAV